MTKEIKNSTKKKPKSAAKIKEKTPNKGRKHKSLEVKLEEIQSDCISIRDRFELEKVNKLKDLEHLFSDAMAREMGVNHSRFITKLYKPITLSFRDVYRFAYYVNFDPKLMVSQVAKEIEEDRKLESELKEFKSIRDMKQYNR